MNRSLQRASGDLTASLLPVEYQQSKIRLTCSLMPPYYGNSYYVSVGGSQEPNHTLLPFQFLNQLEIDTQCYMGDKNINFLLVKLGWRCDWSQI